MALGGLGGGVLWLLFWASPIPVVLASDTMGVFQDGISIAVEIGTSCLCFQGSGLCLLADSHGRKQSSLRFA